MKKEKTRGVPSRSLVRKSILGPMKLNGRMIVSDEVDHQVGIGHQRVEIPLRIANVLLDIGEARMLEELVDLVGVEVHGRDGMAFVEQAFGEVGADKPAGPQVEDFHDYSG